MRYCAIGSVFQLMFDDVCFLIVKIIVLLGVYVVFVDLPFFTISGDVNVLFEIGSQSRRSSFLELKGFKGKQSLFGVY